MTPTRSAPRLWSPAGRPRGAAQVADEGAVRARKARRWALVGAVAGALAAATVWAPATWLATAVARASEGRVVLAEARGTLWNGNAVVVLGGGEGSADATRLPGRLGWTLAPRWTEGSAALQLTLSDDCCILQPVAVQVLPGWGQVRVRVGGARKEDKAGPGDAGPTALVQWPASLLVGLGTPWNTLQPDGALRLTGQGLGLTWTQGRPALEGTVSVELRDFSSRLSTLPRLGSYRLDVRGDPAAPGTAHVQLNTLDGALRLQGQGSWGRTGLRLRGEASASEGNEAALDNLLNIIGRRQGARSVLTIG